MEGGILACYSTYIFIFPSVFNWPMTKENGCNTLFLSFFMCSIYTDCWVWVWPQISPHQTCQKGTPTTRLGRMLPCRKGTPTRLGQTLLMSK